MMRTTLGGRIAVGFAVIATGLGSPAASAGQDTSADPRLLESIEWYLGVTGTVDDARARELLESVAENRDDILARMWIARVHSTGRMTFPEDKPLARRIAAEVIDEIRGLAAEGDVEAIFLMGTAYDEGLGVDIDHVEALRWYSEAAEHDHVLAVHNIGNMYRDGRGVEPDMEQATRFWLRAARAGDVIPALRLAEAYEAGNGVPRDLDAARTWYRRAADAGNANARAALARLGG
ncbi:MAG: tetratricopeptide repeat protein [Gemmatimonadota bacterium]